MYYHNCSLIPGDYKTVVSYWITELLENQCKANQLSKQSFIHFISSL